MARSVVATTVRATMKVARATVPEATRTTAATAATAMRVATKTPNDDKDNNDGNSKKTIK